MADAAKSDLYRDLLPAINSGRVELLDVPRLVAQLCGLERRTARGRRDSIDHGPQGHDDVINATAGVLVALLGGATFKGAEYFEYVKREAERVRHAPSATLTPLIGAETPRVTRSWVRPDGTR